eukprot:m.335378 g.335378  ORF g.335378 m.335378 type:complete len:303 (-) comp17581_c0_seq1:175-1083(-)
MVSIAPPRRKQPTNMDNVPEIQRPPSPERVGDAMDMAGVESQLAVMYMNAHAGTFNGCMETLAVSLEQFLKDQVKVRFPNVVIDHRTSLATLVNILSGATGKLYFQDRPTEYVYCDPRALSRPAEIFIRKYKDCRNDHFHLTDNKNDFIASFEAIHVPLGANHCLVFSPKSSVATFKFDYEGTFIDGRHDGFRGIFRAKRDGDSFDVTDSEHCYADLTLKVLTKRAFNQDEEMKNGPKFPAAKIKTHALIVYYGCERHYAFIGRKEFSWLRTAFGVYRANDTWKTHYFRFVPEGLWRRLLNP